MQMQDVINMENYKQITNELPQDVKDYLEWSNRPEFRKARRERLERRIIAGYNQKIENIAKNQYSEIEPEFCSITITKNALDKCRYMDKKVCKFGRTPLELYMFHTAKQENNGHNDNVIRDIYVAKKQDVTSATCDVSCSGEYQSGFDIKKNLKSKMIGWVHSHGDLPVFQSSRDNFNLKEFVHSYGMKKNVELYNDGKRKF